MWARVLYEIDPRHAKGGPTVFEHIVYAINDGHKGGAGSNVHAGNFMSYARVSVGGTQNYITIHKQNGDITRARVLEFDVDEPVEIRGRRQSVSRWYD